MLDFFTLFIPDTKYQTAVLVCYDLFQQPKVRMKHFWLENVFQERDFEEICPLWLFPGEKRQLTGAVPTHKGESDKIMEQNTDSNGDLEMEDDGPY